jgi:hypothetical protein
MLEFPIDDEIVKEQRARSIVSDQDWYCLNSFLIVALHNGLSYLTKGNSYPSNKTWLQWHQELVTIIAKLKWLHDFDDISMSLYEWCLGKTTMKLVDTATKNKQCVFTHEKPENVDWYFSEALPALEARKQQIVEAVFDWVKLNFQDLWD